MHDLLNIVKNELTKDSPDTIYTAFDSIPVRDKGKIFTVLGIGSYEELDPIYTDDYIFTPAKAELDLTVYAPENYTQEQLYFYYAEKLEAKIAKLCGLSIRLKSLNISPDAKLCRLSLKAVIKLSCMKKQERNEVNS